MAEQERPAVPQCVDEAWLDEFQERPRVPATFKREPSERVFVNRDLNFANITHVGFDMDYTLAEYVSPQYEALTHRLSVERLVEMGYPAEVGQLEYDPTFAIRGLFLDTHLGHLLKVDGFGYVTSVVHGRRELPAAERHAAYPSGQVPAGSIGSRFQPMNTLFNLVDACLYASLVAHLDTGGEEESGAHATKVRGLEVSFQNLYMDVRTAIDYVHRQGRLKSATAERFDELVRDQGEAVALLLQRLRAGGKKVFLLTNSGFDYTNKLMAHMLHGRSDALADWKEFFDYIIVGAQKPKFFNEGTTLREVDLHTGALSVACIRRFERGRVYNGGSIEDFSRMTGTSGPDVLYVGDHIFSDIIISKKKHMWRNLLVVRELVHEIDAWASIRADYHRLQNLEFLFAELFRGLDSACAEQPDTSALQRRIKETVARINARFSPTFGSLFKAGAKPSFFSMQVQRYADLYCSDVTRLLSYPCFYYFSSAPLSLPHEVQMRSRLTE